MSSSVAVTFALLLVALEFVRALERLSEHQDRRARGITMRAAYVAMAEA